MSASLGRVTARLAEPVERVSSELIDLINNNINPPTPVEADDVYVRAMYVVSDEVNSFGGRFPSEEHSRLVALLVDSPVMIGHRKDKLPIARNFHARTVDREGRRWIKSYFYWLKSARGADDLLENIDGGIYKECSIGFTFLFPECSICSKDIRTCEHEPLAEYEINGKTVKCHFNYRRIERVLETSLVYRGAVNDTAVSKDLSSKHNRHEENRAGSEDIVELRDLKSLDPNSQYLVTPFYDGLLVQIRFENGKPSLRRLNGEPLDPQVTNRFDWNSLSEIIHETDLYGLLVPYRGRERLSLSELNKLLDNRRSPISRLELKLIPSDNTDPMSITGGGRRDCVRVLKSRLVRADQVDQVAPGLMTRRGVRIWKADELPPVSAGYRYRLSEKNQKQGEYRIICNPSGEIGRDNIQFVLFSNGEQHRFQIRQGNLTRLLKGVKFVADELPATDDKLIRQISQHSGRVIEMNRPHGGFVMRLDGPLQGWFALRKIRLGGKERYLFYRRGNH